MSTAHPFERLTPDFILDAVDACGYHCDGRLLALNSYENRVYQVGHDDGEPLVAKFYRPGRWSDAAIIEEHEFVAELLAQDLPVVGPLSTGGRTLHHYDGFRLALFERRGGRAPDLDHDDNLRTMGRCLARMHTVGAARPFVHRDRLSVAEFGRASVSYVQDGWVPADLRAAYDSIVVDVLAHIEAAFERARDVRAIRVHGDCHGGNVLWRDGAPHFVDFDDARMAPAIQDLWMLLSGQPEEQRAQLACVLDGYEEFADFDYRELALVEALRTLRMLHYSAWLARRWDDPAFPRAFPWFATQQWWERHVLELREQLGALAEPFDSGNQGYSGNY